MTRLQRKLLLPLMTIAVLLLMVLAMAGYFTEKIPPGLQPLVDTDSAEAVQVIERETPAVEATPASIEARETTIISSRLLARITNIAVRAGDQVEQGQLLLQLEKSDLLARAQQARGRIRSIDARLSEARDQLKRSEALYGRGLIAVADRDAARANAAALQADMASAQQVLEEAESAVGYSEIRAPIAGRIVDRFAEKGDTAAPGQKLLSLYNPFSLRVEAWVREELALSLHTGDELEVEVPAAAVKLSSRIEEIVPAADPGSRSFLVRAILPAKEKLLPGMYARLLVPAGSRKRLLVPADRVARIGQLNIVWVAANGHTQRRFVRLGQRDDAGMIEVISGVASGDLVLPVPP